MTGGGRDSNPGKADALTRELSAQGSTSSPHAETAAFDQSASISRAEEPAPHAAPQFASLPHRLGRYRIDRLLGRGGMGSVYLSHDLQLDRSVALKIPRLPLGAADRNRARFLREAQAIATLTHPHICPLYDVGQIDGVDFLAMAYIQGRPLSDYLQTAKLQPERGVALTVYKIAQALQEAHQKGILHRDLKPANIMIDSRGEPIVMDFGLAHRLDDQAESRLTQEGMVVGTPSYMAPEQIDNRAPIGPATDIYSLGVVLYELLTGQCPFRGSVVSVIGQVLHSQAAEIVTRRASVSLTLVEICRRAMAKEPSQRFSSMHEFAAALAGFLKGATSVSTQSELVAIPEPTGLEALLAADESTSIPAFALRPVASRRRSAESRQAWIVAASLLGVLIVVVMAVAVWQNSGEDADQQVASRDDASHKPAGAAGPKLAASNSPSAAVTSVREPPAEIAHPNPVAEPPVDKPADVVAADEAEDMDFEPAAAQGPPIVPSGQAEPRTSDDSDLPNQKGKPTAPGTPSANDPPPQNGPAATLAPAPSGNPPAVKPKQPSPFAFPQGGGPGEPPQLDMTAGSLEENFEAADHNHDGKLDRTEAPLHIIQRADKNADGKMSLKELETAFARLKDKLFAPPTAAQMRRMQRGGPGGPPPPR